MYLKRADTEDEQKLPRFQQIQKITFGNQPFEKTGSGKIKKVLILWRCRQDMRRYTCYANMIFEGKIWLPRHSRL